MMVQVQFVIISCVFFFFFFFFFFFQKTLKLREMHFNLNNGCWGKVLEMNYVLSCGQNLKVCNQSKQKDINCTVQKQKVREQSGECHNHKPQPFPDTKRKRKQTKPNKHKSNKRTKSTKISSLFPKRGNRNAKRTEKLKNKPCVSRNGKTCMQINKFRDK